MIERLTIRDFKGVKEGSLELSPITILLGANNSGKSTILEALFLAPNPFRWVPYVLLRLPQPPYYVENHALGVVYFLHQTLDYQGYAFLLHNYTSDLSEIECDINGNKSLLKFIKIRDDIYLNTNRPVDNYSSIRIEGVDTLVFGRTYTGNLSTTVHSSKLLIEETLLINPNLINPCYEYLRRNWAPIVNTGIMRKVAKDASMLSPEIYMDLTMEPFIGGQLDIYAYLEDGRRIRLGDLGEGIQSYVVSRILYEWVKPETLLWDDMESHFNPRILRHVAEWFSDLLNGGKQIILSTHSLEAAKVIAGVNEEETGIYLTSLDSSILKTKKLRLSEVESLQAAGIDARTAEAFLI